MATTNFLGGVIYTAPVYTSNSNSLFVTNCDDYVIEGLPEDDLIDNPIIGTEEGVIITQLPPESYDGNNIEFVPPNVEVHTTEGATFYPNVDENKNLTWTNNKGLANPPPVNIMGDGYIPVPGVDYFTEEDITNLHESIVVVVDNSYELPNVGELNTVYMTRNEGKTYTWSDIEIRYICTGADYSKIKVIDGNLTE